MERLPERDISHEYLADLGRYRDTETVKSPNAAWNNDSFRTTNYELTDEFQAGLDELIALETDRRVNCTISTPMPI